MSKVTLPEAVKPISWLFGKWTSVSAKGKYPTILPFEYHEELEFTCVGQPMFVYSSKTWNAAKTKPMHLESGFLQIKPNTNQVALIAAHNFGITTVEEGTVTGEEMKLKTTEISRVSYARDPAVKILERHFQIKDNKLECVVFMETSNTPLTEHLRVQYKKQTD